MTNNVRLNVALVGLTSWTCHGTADDRQTLCGRRAWTPGPFVDFRERLARCLDDCCKTCARLAAGGERT